MACHFWQAMYGIPIPEVQCKVARAMSEYKLAQAIEFSPLSSKLSKKHKLIETILGRDMHG